jgi:uncharacterized protein (TIGR02145 family)
VTAAPSFTCGTSTIADYNNINAYTTVSIGNQCWMKENLRVSKYRNGEVIPVSSDNVQWSNLNKGSRCLYENDSVLFNLPYGNLYNLYAVIDDKKLCPNGWHVPTDTEWTTLTEYLGGEIIAGGKMKTVGTAYWNDPNTGATNESGFSAVPGGFRSRFDGGFISIKNDAFVKIGMSHGRSPPP